MRSAERYVLPFVSALGGAILLAVAHYVWTVASVAVNF